MVQDQYRFLLALGNEAGARMQVDMWFGQVILVPSTSVNIDCVDVAGPVFLGLQFLGSERH